MFGKHHCFNELKRKVSGLPRIWLNWAKDWNLEHHCALPQEVTCVSDFCLQKKMSQTPKKYLNQERARDVLVMS